MDVLVPRDVIPSRCASRLIDSTARFASPFTGATRTVARPGDRWAFRTDFDNIRGSSRARLETFIASMRGAANRALFTPVDYTQRGSFPAPELLTGGTFTGTDGWTATGATFSVADRMAFVQNSGAAAGRITNTSPFATEGNTVAYVLRIVSMDGNQANWKYNVGTSAGGSQITTQTASSTGYVVYPFVTAATSLYLSLFCNTAVVGDYVSFLYASCARCPSVKGANQTGSTLAVDMLPASTAGLLLPGDWVAVGLELKRVTAPLNSDGSGNGTLQFSPPLRASPADNDPVIVNQPLGRFILSSSENGWESSAGIYSTYSFDMVEAP